MGSNEKFKAFEESRKQRIAAGERLLVAIECLSGNQNVEDKLRDIFGSVYYRDYEEYISLAKKNDADFEEWFFENTTEVANG